MTPLFFSINTSIILGFSFESCYLMCINMLMTERKIQTDLDLSHLNSLLGAFW